MFGGEGFDFRTTPPPPAHTELGKARVKAMVEAFGGKVTSSVSGRTDVLIVGKEPGASKVTLHGGRVWVQDLWNQGVNCSLM